MIRFSSRLATVYCKYQSAENLGKLTAQLITFICNWFLSVLFGIILITLYVDCAGQRDTSYFSSFVWSTFNGIQIVSSSLSRSSKAHNSFFKGTLQIYYLRFLLHSLFAYSDTGEIITTHVGIRNCSLKRKLYEVCKGT